MLAIRMQRLGRKGHPTYRVVVQDSRQTPTSGKVVAQLGSYDPHTKTSTLVKAKAELFMSNGAQPSDRVVRLFAGEGVMMPKWVKQKTVRERTIRHADKLRKNRPDEPKVEPAAEVAAEPEPTETEKANDQSAEEAVQETPIVEVAEAETTEPAAEAEAVTTADGEDEEPKPTPPGEDEFPEDKTSDKAAQKA